MATFVALALLLPQARLSIRPKPRAPSLEPCGSSLG